ncbi:hypothetical protein [Desulfovibrio sp. UCD-KL4C]|uniref:hypothetical protein n=1 Tax=Desulfovibrio sp. UCD-KL4C TaxID=2578120 RepID=UPI0025BB5449|nr:hypothetical protein [Desulfovibrio sp. UCD-KL4C]
MTRKNQAIQKSRFKNGLKKGVVPAGTIIIKLWLKVSDFSSQGRSHRIYGHKSQRTISFLILNLPCF